MSWRRHFRALAEETNPSAEARARLVRRVVWPETLLRETREAPSAAAVARVVRGARPRGRRWWPILVLPLAAALALAVRPTGLDQELLAADPTSADLTRDVRAVYTGSGRVTGTSAAPRLRWEVGTLALDVTPHRGIDLQVETDEGVVSVVGTAFTVTRDALGTEVRVERGEVAVACEGEGKQPVTDGGVALCLPVRAAGMLSRAQALVDLHAPTDAVLRAIERGLTLATPGDPAVGELRVLRIQVLLPLGRDDEVRRDARAYLAAGGPRASEVQAVLAAIGP